MVVVVLTDHGSKVHKSKEMFKISYGMSTKPMSYVPAKLVETFIIDANVGFTSGSFNLIKKYGISVYWHDYRNPGMMLLPQFNNGMASTRREQYQAVEDERGIHIAKQIIIQSCKNRVVTLKKLSRRKNKLKKQISKVSKKTEKIIKKLGSLESEKISECRDILMSSEAQISKVYFAVIRDVLKEHDWEFANRSRRPANDAFNAMLNYGYAILKSQITQYIVISGLDIYAGILHVDRSGRHSLTLDLMEEFRQVVVDEVVLPLILDDRITRDMFETSDEGVELNKNVKGIFLQSLFEKIDERFGRYRIKQHFLLQSRSIVNYITGEISSYEPFRNKVRKA